MRVLFWLSQYHLDRGGRALFVSELAGALEKLGHSILWARENSNLEDAPPGQGDFVTRASDFGPGASQLSFSLFVQSLEAFLDVQRPDIIHCHRVGMIESLVLCQLAARRGIPLIYTEHEAPVQSAEAFAQSRRELLARFERIVVPSSSSQAVLNQLFPSLSQKTVVINNGVSIGQQVHRVDLGSVFFSGRHSEEKGLKWLLSAWSGVLAAHPGASLAIAGTGPQTAAMKLFAQSLGVAGSIRWLGWCERAMGRSHAARSQVVVVPSRWAEPFGLTAAEASAEGRPVVVARAGALTELVVHGETGVHVPVDDNGELSRAVCRMLDNPAWCDVLGAAGRDHVRENFSMSESAQRHVRLYEDLNEEARGE